MEELFLGIEECRHLQELGLDMSDAAFCWRRQVRGWDGMEPRDYMKKWHIDKNEVPIVQNMEKYDTVPTYTLQEITNRIPKGIAFQLGKATILEELVLHFGKGFMYESEKPVKVVSQMHRRPHGTLETYDGNPLMDAYKMLCWTIETEHLKTK